jgi:hypothetical protein
MLNGGANGVTSQGLKSHLVNKRMNIKLKKSRLMISKMVNGSNQKEICNLTLTRIKAIDQIPINKSLKDLQQKTHLQKIKPNNDHTTNITTWIC